MEWETPGFVEISLACEISGYANAELSVVGFQQRRKTQHSPRKTSHCESAASYSAFTEDRQPDKSCSTAPNLAHRSVAGGTPQA